MSNPPDSSTSGPRSKAAKRSRRWLLLSLVFVAGVASLGLMNFGIAYTNEMAFCTSCHTMHTNFAEYKETIHYQNPSGVQATCSDCHVPKPFVPKMITKIIAAKDVWHEMIGTIDTPEKFEARRWEMANRVWKKMKDSDSRECRSCHDFSNMDLSAQDRTARSKHSAAPDKGQTCIDCHKGIAHKEPEEPDAEDTEAEAETAEAPAEKPGAS